MTDPEKIVIELRPQPAKLESGQPWPWDQRRRHLLKYLLRRLGFRAVILSETYPPASEPASTPEVKG